MTVPPNILPTRTTVPDRGYDPNAMKTLLVAGIPTILLAILPKTFADMGLFDVSWIGNFAWFIGCGLAFAVFVMFERLDPRVPTFTGENEGISDGTLPESAPETLA